MADLRELLVRLRAASARARDPLTSEALALIVEAAEEITELRHRIETLHAAVGDPEKVIDADGALPRERRRLHRERFKVLRTTRVAELRAIVAAAGPTAGSTAEDTRTRLTTLLAMPAPTVNQMRADCPVPAALHRLGHHGEEFAGPCIAWPLARERMRSAPRIHRRFQPHSYAVLSGWLSDTTTRGGAR